MSILSKIAVGALAVLGVRALKGKAKPAGAQRRSIAEPSEHSPEASSEASSKASEAPSEAKAGPRRSSSATRTYEPQQKAPSPKIAAPARRSAAPPPGRTVALKATARKRPARRSRSKHA
jgi:hypothetical protein